MDRGDDRLDAVDYWRNVDNELGDPLPVVSSAPDPQISSSGLVWLRGRREDPVEMVLGLEIPDPDVLALLHVLRTEIGLAGPFLHLGNLHGRSLHLVG